MHRMAQDGSEHLQGLYWRGLSCGCEELTPAWLPTPAASRLHVTRPRLGFCMRAPRPAASFSGRHASAVHEMGVSRWSLLSCWLPKRCWQLGNTTASSPLPLAQSQATTATATATLSAPGRPVHCIRLVHHPNPSLLFVYFCAPVSTPLVSR